MFKRRDFSDNKVNLIFVNSGIHRAENLNCFTAIVTIDMEDPDIHDHRVQHSIHGMAFPSDAEFEVELALPSEAKDKQFVFFCILLKYLDPITNTSLSQRMLFVATYLLSKPTFAILPGESGEVARINLLQLIPNEELEKYKPLRDALEEHP